MTVQSHDVLSPASCTILHRCVRRRNTANIHLVPYTYMSLNRISPRLKYNVTCLEDMLYHHSINITPDIPWIRLVELCLYRLRCCAVA